MFLQFLSFLSRNVVCLTRRRRQKKNRYSSTFSSSLTFYIRLSSSVFLNTEVNRNKYKTRSEGSTGSGTWLKETGRVRQMKEEQVMFSVV